MTVKRNLKKKKDSFMYRICKIQVNIHKILIEKTKPSFLSLKLWDKCRFNSEYSVSNYTKLQVATSETLVIKFSVFSIKMNV